MGTRYYRLLYVLCLTAWLVGCQPLNDSPASSETAIGSSPTPALTRALATPAPQGSPTLVQPPPDAQPTPAGHPSDAESGYVVVYSDTARTQSAIAALMEQHPGLEAETYTLSSLDIYLQLLDDLARGQPLADVYLVSDAPRTLALLADGKLVNRVPPQVAAALPLAEREPLLTHHWTALTWAMVGKLDDPSALDSWWDLTTPTWRGRVVLPDPTVDERTLILFATAAQQGSALEAAYVQEFGRQIELDPDCPTAGYQWVKDLLSNDVNLVLSDAEVLAALGAAEAPGSVVGLCGSEQWEKAARNAIDLQPQLEMAPAAGLMWRSYLALVAGSARSQAAELAIEWLMGDAAGAGGYAVWYKAGFYPARSDVQDPAGAPPRADLAERLWQVDVAALEDHLGAVRNLVAPWVGHPVGGR